MDMLKKCLNPKVLLGLGGVAVVLLIVAPKAFLAYLPLLIFAACPLSMILMMGTMDRGHDSSKKPQDELTMLRQRFAKGEISEEDYEHMKQKLTS